MERYFASHNERHSATVTLIIFGWSGQTPWHQTVRWDRTAATLESGVFDDETFLHAGEDAKFVHDAVTELRSAIMGHKRRMANVFEGEDGVHEAEKVSSQHDSAARRVAEQSLIDKILSEANESIGGTLQKLELAGAARRLHADVG